MPAFNSALQDVRNEFRIGAGTEVLLPGQENRAQLDAFTDPLPDSHQFEVFGIHVRAEQHGLRCAFRQERSQQSSGTVPDG